MFSYKKALGGLDTAIFAKLTIRKHLQIQGSYESRSICIHATCGFPSKEEL